MNQYIFLKRTNGKLTCINGMGLSVIDCCYMLADPIGIVMELKLLTEYYSYHLLLEMKGISKAEFEMWNVLPLFPKSIGCTSYYLSFNQ